MSSSLGSCLDSSILSFVGCISQQISIENPFISPFCIFSHTSGFSTLYVQKRLPSSMFSNPIGFIPLLVSLINHSINVTPQLIDHHDLN